MAIDVRTYKKKINNQKLHFNLVPFIDILFTVMIFLVVTSNFSATTMDATPEVTDVSGAEEYYVVPVSGLHKVIVNGEDFSSLIERSSIGVHVDVLNEGEVIIKPGKIIITVPDGFDVNRAVSKPKL